MSNVMNTVSKALYAPVMNVDIIPTIEMFPLRMVPLFSEGKLALTVFMIWYVFAGSKVWWRFWDEVAIALGFIKLA